MKNARLTLVLMAGLPGAGKSTLARKLAEDLRWHIVDKDYLKGELLKQGWNEEEAGIAAYEQSFVVVRNTLKEKQTSVILDTAALYSFILDHAQDIVFSMNNVQLKVILCVANRNLRNRRLRERPAQITTIRVDPATIADYLREFKHLPPDTLILFTIRSIEESFAEAKDYLVN